MNHQAGWLQAVTTLLKPYNTLVSSRTFTPALSPPSVRIEGQAVGGQPGRQVVWALEVEQGNSCGEGCAYGQGFQLLQRQRLDLGGGGTSKWAAAAVELAKSNAAGLIAPPFLTALSQPILYRPGMADLSRGIPAITMICAFPDQGGWPKSADC